jgi:formylglycine-generating enzyme required for sulfatase activity/uncharacterized caspase-like protein
MNETRRALIVANSEYQAGFRGLVSPARDAEELARVLGDPSIGGFEVTTILDRSAGAISDAIDVFFNHSGARRDDLLLLYFSGHGVTVEDGHLYLAAADSQFAGSVLRRATAVAAGFVDETMRRSRSRRQILILDCCHSGAFAEGMLVKGELPNLETSFTPVQGKGRIILTASTGRQFAQEDPDGRPDQPSLYTHFLVRGLETGEADHGDGEVQIDELHEYLCEQLRLEAPWQTPTKSGYVEGQLYIARTKVVKPAELPRGLRDAFARSSDLYARLGAVTGLEALLQGEHSGLAVAAREALAQLQETDDSSMVREKARCCLINFDARKAPADNIKCVEPPQPRPEGVKAATETTSTDSYAPVGQARASGGDEGETVGDGSWYRHRYWAALARVAQRRPATAVVAIVVISIIAGVWLALRPAAIPKRPTEGSQTPGPASASASNGGTAPNPPNDSTRKTRVNRVDGLTYVWVPPGEFMMGCSPGDTECDKDENKPPELMQVLNGFWLGQTEVTQAAWKKVNRGDDPSHVKGDQLPVESIDWNQASKYCTAIGGRLPNEKEWEYAARAGTTGSRYGALDAVAWYGNNSAGTTHPVGLKRVNPFGFYDVLGNVSEWTADNYDAETKVSRGGSWYSNSRVVRVSVRSWVEPTNSGVDVGFRCVAEFR